jgi:hypothetical protein
MSWVFVWMQPCWCGVIVYIASAPVTWDPIYNKIPSTLYLLWIPTPLKFILFFWCLTDINSCKRFVSWRPNCIISSDYVMKQKIYFAKWYTCVWYTLLMLIQCRNKFSTKCTKFFKKCISPVFLRRVLYVTLKSLDDFSEVIGCSLMSVMQVF